MNLVNILLLVSLSLPLIAVFAILLAKDNKLEAAKNARLIAMLAGIINLLFSAYFYISIRSSGYNYIINYSIFNNIFFKFSIGLDGISLLFLLVTNLLFVIVFLFINVKKFTKNCFVILLLLEFSVIATFISFNLWVFYICFELSVFLVFFLMKNNNKSSYSQYKFLIYNAFGSLLMFACFVYIVYTTKQGSFTGLLSASFSYQEQRWLWWGLFLAFIIKSGIFPFHLWVKDIYSSSDNIINLILSGILIKFGIYGLVRIVLPSLPLANEVFSNIAFALALLTAFYAIFMAFTADNIKNFIAYFSLSHVGIIIFGIFSLNVEGVTGAIFQSISHSIFMIGFILIFIIIEDKLKVTKFSEISGLIKYMPILCFFIMIISLAGLSMPGTNSFIGEFLILQGVFNSSVLFGIFGTLTVVFSAIIILNMYKRMAYDHLSGSFSGFKDISFKDINYIEIIVFTVISILIIGIGFYPQIVLDLISPYSNQIIGFIKSQEVIHGFIKG